MASPPTAALQGVNLQGKRVLIRADFNVPMKDGKVKDDSRIRETLPTIQKVINAGGRAILMAHLGRPKGQPNKKYSLKPVQEALAKQLGKEVKWADDCANAEGEVDKLRDGEVLLLENLRFHDGEQTKDKAKREEFARKLASYADIFVCDAFGTIHRASASITGVPEVLGNGYAGCLVLKEVAAVRRIIDNPKKPVVLIMGGGKVASKLTTLPGLLKRVDIVLLGGAVGLAFVEAAGSQVGKSSADDKEVKIEGRKMNAVAAAKRVGEMAKKHNVKVFIPKDHACGSDPKKADKEKPTITEDANVPENMYAFDIGPKTIEEYTKILAHAGTVIWAGPVGMFECEAYAKGCEALAKTIAENKKCASLIGGGDTASALGSHKKQITHVSTGGGALLEFVEGERMPGLESLRDPALKGKAKL
jgi:phosphoglycerate kinase